ncbi:unnamed protein product, partial [marine sediment metagenome]
MPPEYPANFTPVPGISYDECLFPHSWGATAVCCLWEAVDRVQKR